MWKFGESATQQSNKPAHQKSNNTATHEPNMNKNSTGNPSTFEQKIEQHRRKINLKSIKNQPKIIENQFLGASKRLLEGFGRLLGGFGEFQKNLIASWTEKWAERGSAPSGFWGHVGPKLGPSWDQVGPSWDQVAQKLDQDGSTLAPRRIQKI